MNKSQKRSPVLYVLLIAALALNSTMSIVLLANRARLDPQITREPQSTATAGQVENSKPVQVDKTETASAVPTPRREAVSVEQAKKPRPIKAARVDTPQTARAKEEEKINFLPAIALYRVSRSTTLVTREGNRQIFLPEGTRVHVAGLTQSGKALVVSRNGNPDGFVPGWAIEEIRDDKISSSPTPRKGTGTTQSPGEDFLGSLPTPRVSGGSYGGSISLGPAYIYVSRDGQISGSFPR